MLRECVVLVLVCVFLAESLTGRGFFCRDPETGKLHPVNSTWTASSFCGKYHCKLKRKNMTSSEYAPQRQINITNIKLLGENLKMVDVQKKDIFVKKDDVATNVVNSVKKTEPAIIKKYTLKKIQGIKQEDDKIASNKDRYLTDEEIKSLTEVLHTVKKVDLDAIVEIYNLAQDIYKELDKTSTDQVLQEAMSTVNTLDKKNIKSNMLKKVTKNDHASYWYEPLGNGKIKITDLVRPDVIRTDMNPEVSAVVIDMLPAASKVNVGLKTKKSTILPPIQPPLPATRTFSDTFFNGPLSHKDFGKLPYYYPMSNFQRMSSYKHEQKKTLSAYAGTLAPAPTTKLTMTPAPVTALATFRNSAYKPVTSKLLQTGEKYQKELRPSIFMPYPFTNIQHYNWSFPQHLYHEKLFDKLVARKKDDTNKQNTLKRRVDKQDNAVLINPDLEDFQDLQIRASMKAENVVNTNINQEEGRRLAERRKPDWQTDSLPQQILEEVRAHIQEKQRLFINPVSLRKKVKLERVAKLLNMDELTRTKRSEEGKRADDEGPLKPELYEVYIERIMCNADYSIPGYFRYGNLSQPFPECCPQRI